MCTHWTSTEASGGRLINEDENCYGGSGRRTTNNFYERVRWSFVLSPAGACDRIVSAASVRAPRYSSLGRGTCSRRNATSGWVSHPRLRPRPFLSVYSTRTCTCTRTCPCLFPSTCTSTWHKHVCVYLCVHDMSMHTLRTHMHIHMHITHAYIYILHHRHRHRHRRSHRHNICILAPMLCTS